jgi:hypothetical protein
MPSLLRLLPVLLFSTSVQARPLVFTNLSLSADAGVSLSYSLSPDCWAQVEPITRMGTAPTIVVQYQQPGYDRTSHVELMQGSRELSLASGDWPPGMTATISIHGTLGDFDSITWPGGSGRTVSVPISGGVAGGDTSDWSTDSSSSSSTSSSPSPSGSWSSSSSSSVSTPELSVENVGSALEQLASLAAQEQARRERAAMEAQQQADWEAAIQQEREIRGIMNDLSHPLSAACNATFGDEDQYKKCVRKGLTRNYGAEEVSACNRMDIVGYKFECVESLVGRNHIATNVINACVDSFGADREGIKCIWRTQETRFDPSSDVRACGLAFDDYGFASACISRYAEVAWEPAAVLHACVTGFEGEDQLVCAKLAGAAGKPPHDRIDACVASFDDQEQALECVHIMAHSTSDSASAIPFCAQLFEPKGKRYDCLSALRGAQDRDPERLDACMAETSNGKRMKCVEGDR